MSCIRDWTTSQYGSRETGCFVLRAMQPFSLFISLLSTDDVIQRVILDSRGIRFETRFHCAFNGTVDVLRPWKETIIIIIALIAVLVHGERPILHLPGVLQPTNGRATPIILPIQIEKLALVTRDIHAKGVPYGGGIEVFHHGCNVRLDLVGYLSCGGAFLAGSALGSALLGLATWRLFRALYLDHLPLIKHNRVFLRGRISEIHLLLLSHRLHVSDGILKEVRLMSTIALKG